MTLSTFVIPAAGASYKAKSENPILLTKFSDGKYLFEKQIKAIRSVFHKCHIIYITGFNCDKVDEKLKNLDCSIIHNLDYRNTTSAYSIGLASQKLNRPFYFLYGNLFFDKVLITQLKNYEKPIKKSFLISNNNFSRKSIGVSYNGLCDYNFKSKWGKTGYFDENAYPRLNKLCNDIHKQYFLFEIINQMINDGIRFNVHSVNCFLTQIDKSKVIKDINKYIEN